MPDPRDRGDVPESRGPDAPGPESRGERRGGPEGARVGHDSELDLYRLLGFAGGLAGLLVAAAIASWLLFGAFEDELVGADPPRSPLPEARARELPPEPRLQTSPPMDMAELRAREIATLTSYGWVDRGAGIARIPIDVAIELYPALAKRPRSGPPGGPEEGDGPEKDGGAP